MSFLRNGELVDANGKAVGEGQTEGTSDVDTLRQENETLKTQLTDAQAQALPADAHARLVKVNGIGERLADQALEALKAAPEVKAEAPKE